MSFLWFRGSKEEWETKRHSTIQMCTLRNSVSRKAETEAQTFGSLERLRVGKTNLGTTRETRGTRYPMDSKMFRQSYLKTTYGQTSAISVRCRCLILCPWWWHTRIPFPEPQEEHPMEVCARRKSEYVSRSKESPRATTFCCSSGCSRWQKRCKGGIFRHPRADVPLSPEGHFETISHFEAKAYRRTGIIGIGENITVHYRRRFQETSWWVVWKMGRLSQRKNIPWRRKVLAVYTQKNPFCLSKSQKQCGISVYLQKISGTPYTKYDQFTRWVFQSYEKTPPCPYWTFGGAEKQSCLWDFERKSLPIQPPKRLIRPKYMKTSNSTTDRQAFNSLLDRAIQPTGRASDKTPAPGKSAGYTDKRTRPSSSGDTSGKPSDKSRLKSA